MSLKFNQLVKEACAAEQALRLHTADRRLSAAAYLDEALRVADSTPEALADLEAKLTTATADLSGIRVYLKAIERMISDGRVPQPPLNMKRAAFPGRDCAARELLAFGANVFELWALAALRVAAKRPEAFGPVEDLAGYEAKEAALKAWREALFQRIGTEFSHDDLVIGEVRSDGAALITFELAAGMVPLAPRRDAGERLITHLVNNEPL